MSLYIELEKNFTDVLVVSRQGCGDPSPSGKEKG
jgi:hypothetical protein